MKGNGRRPPFTEGALKDGIYDPAAPRAVEYLIDKRGRAYQRQTDGSLRRVKDPVEEQRIVARFKEQEFKEQDLAANMVAAIEAGSGERAGQATSPIGGESANRAATSPRALPCPPKVEA